MQRKGVLPRLRPLLRLQYNTWVMDGAAYANKHEGVAHRHYIETSEAQTCLSKFLLQGKASPLNFHLQPRVKV